VRLEIGDVACHDAEFMITAVAAINRTSPSDQSGQKNSARKVSMQAPARAAQPPRQAWPV
jgi:hypothetical protein